MANLGNKNVKDLYKNMRAKKEEPVPSASSPIIFAGPRIGDVRLEEVGDWGKLLNEVMEDLKKPENFAFSGGQVPVDRRLSLMHVKVSELVYFAGTCEYRGHRHTRYAKKNDESAKKLKIVCQAMLIKGPETEYVGKNSVVSIKVAFSDLFIHFRKTIGPATFNKERYEGNCPVMYQWIGSLGAMYKEPENDEPEGLRQLQYIQWYEEFQNWYIDVRRRAARKQGGQKETDASAVELQQDMSRTYYSLTLSSFSANTRRAWNAGNYSVKVEKGEVEISQEDLEGMLEDAGVTNRARMAKARLAIGDGKGPSAAKKK